MTKTWTQAQKRVLLQLSMTEETNETNNQKYIFHVLYLLIQQIFLTLLLLIAVMKMCNKYLLNEETTFFIRAFKQR